MLKSVETETMKWYEDSEKNSINDSLERLKEPSELNNRKITNDFERQEHIYKYLTTQETRKPSTIID